MVQSTCGLVWLRCLPGVSEGHGLLHYTIFCREKLAAFLVVCAVDTTKQEVIVAAGHKLNGSNTLLLM